MHKIEIFMQKKRLEVNINLVNVNLLQFIKSSICENSEWFLKCENEEIIKWKIMVGLVNNYKIEM